MFRTPFTLFRTVAIAEMISWTLLLGGLLLRALFDLRVAVTIGGGVHGFVFLAYAATAIIVAVNQRWSIGPALVAVGSAVVPYATLPTEIWLHRTGRLTGTWRTDATEDPRDGRSMDRVLRFFLRRPWIFATALVVVVAVVFVMLLILGPPGERD